MLEPNLCFRNTIDGFFFLISAGFLLLVMEKMFLLMFLGFANPFFSISNFDGDFLTRSAYTLSFSIPKYKRR